MISSILQGGLGNQLFQISAAVSLAADNDDNAVFNIKNHLLPYQGRKCENYLGNVFRNISFATDLDFKHLHRENKFEYEKIHYKPNMCLYGYFQSEKYFSKNADLIRDLVSIDNVSYDIIHDKYNLVLQENTVSIHIRRGDYLKLGDTHPVCPYSYYKEAISFFPKESNFLIFSDDVQWCKENFKEKHFTFIEGEQDYIDLYMMSLCEHNIIANSSFSWWGAWLNRNKEKKVIAPKNWFADEVQYNTKDLLPNDWITI